MHDFLQAIVLLLLVLAQSGEQLERQRLEEVADGLSRELQQIFNSATAFDVLQNHTTELLGEQPARKLNGSEIVSSIAQRISADLTQIADTLKETAAFAGRLYNDNLGFGCCSDECDRESRLFNRENCSEQCDTPLYCQARFGAETKCNETDLRLDFNFFSDRNVSFSDSAIHIPVNIYENDPSVLCFVQWTDNLTSQFQENQNGMNYQHLVVSQFLGSNSGILRFFPASDWALINQCDRCPFEPVDTYDARRRPWFVNTVAGSKFVVILLDLSGSMSGFQTLLAQLAVNELLKSLSENDYFFVIRVGDNSTSGPLGCFTGRTRASPENILAMIEVVKVTNDTHGRAEFGPALERAFQEINSSSECHHVIAIFTDGDVEIVLPTEPFAMYNSEKKVRVFTYLIGRGSDNANLELIARCNRGKMGRIREYNDIISKIRILTNELRSEALPPPEDSQAFWTRYRDVFADLVLTASLPVLTASLPVLRETNDSREFVGVLGMDINPQLINWRIREHRLGPGGYGFVVDNNGQLITHPLISKELIATLSADDLLSLDVSNFEHSNPPDKFDWVRQALINRTTGSHPLTVWTAVEREQRYLLQNVTYYYSPIENTPFSIALVLPSPEAPLPDYPPLNQSHSTPTLMQDEISLAERPYCQWDVDSSANPAYFLSHLISALSDDTSPRDCNESLYRPLLSDLWLVDQVLPFWRQDTETNGWDDSDLSSIPFHITCIFAQFSSGLSRCVFPSNSIEGPSCQDLPYLRLAGSNRNLSLYAGGYSNQSAVALKSLSATSEVGVVGVVGALLPAALLTELLENAGMEAEQDDVIYLVDSSGYVVASTEQSHVALLLSEVQSEVASDLVKNGVFITAVLRGYELWPCDRQRATRDDKMESVCKESAGTSLYGGGVLVTMWGWVVDGTLWTVIRLTCISVLQSILSYAGLAEETPGSCEAVQFCLLQTTAWQLSEEPLPTSGSVMCNCTSEQLEYNGTLVPSTNLLLLVVSNNCNCTMDTATRVREHALCSCDDVDRYRRGHNSSCYDNPMDSPLPAGCSGTTSFLQSHSTSVWITLLLSVLTLSSDSITIIL